MVGFLKNHTCLRIPALQHVAKRLPMGVDIGDNAVKMVQLAGNGKSTSLIAGGVKNQPDDVKSGSGNWQRWAIEAICELTANGSFRGRSVIAAMPPGDVFIDHIRMPKIGDGHASDGRLRDAVFSKIKQKLPFEPNDAMIKYIPAEENKVVVIAAERTIIDRHLAIYENANLQIRSIAVWPIALINSYTTFFGRRRADVEAVVMLLQIDTNRTNVVICRHKNLLFARSIPIGANQFDSDEEVATQSYDKSQSGNQVARLVLELTACKRQFGSMYKKAQIERLIFLSGQVGTKNICATVAKRLEMPAQIGDCLAAVEMADSSYSGIDRRNCQVNWATAFGLSLS